MLKLGFQAKEFTVSIWVPTSIDRQAYVCIWIRGHPTWSVSSAPHDSPLNLTASAYFTYCPWCWFVPVIDDGVLYEMRQCVRMISTILQQGFQSDCSLSLPFKISITPHSPQDASIACTTLKQSISKWGTFWNSESVSNQWPKKKLSSFRTGSIRTNANCILMSF